MFPCKCLGANLWKPKFAEREQIGPYAIFVCFGQYAELLFTIQKDQKSINLLTFTSRAFQSASLILKQPKNAVVLNYGNVSDCFGELYNFNGVCCNLSTTFYTLLSSIYVFVRRMILGLELKMRMHEIDRNRFKV